MERTISLRLRGSSITYLKHLEEQHITWRVKRNTIILAAIRCFARMAVEDRQRYIDEVRAEDGRLYYNRGRE